MMRCSGDLDKANDRANHMEHHVRELIGVIDEFLALPCSSLKKRMKEASLRASIAVVSEGE